MKDLFAALLLASLAFVGCTRQSETDIDRVEWTAMGTVAALQGRKSAQLADFGAAVVTAQSCFKRVSSEFNRFDTNSTICRLGRPSAFGRPCWDAANALKRLSDGAFNPHWRGTNALDFGAIAKGFAVDVAADALQGMTGDLLVDLGGNLKSVRGDWRTGVRAPSGLGLVAVVTLHAGEALATSAEYFRGKHIFDGRTSQPVSNDVAAVTVLGTSAMWADGLSTTLFVLGPEAGSRFLRERWEPKHPPVSVLWVLYDGQIRKLDPYQRFQAAD